ncbi:hypothetical protein G9A89_022412 [Geosiphon pyriformis]|nr:hypothetical protein G9A89_022412 [Geosiphon pyriformis]
MREFIHDTREKDPNVLKLGVLLIMFDVYIKLFRLEKPYPNKYFPFNEQPLFIRYIYILFLCVIEFIVFQFGVRLAVSFYIGHQRAIIKYNYITMALIISSFGKLLLILMVIWDYNELEYSRLINIIVLTSNIEALSVFLNIGYFPTFLIMCFGLLIKTLLIRYSKKQLFTPANRKTLQLSTNISLTTVMSTTRTLTTSIISSRTGLYGSSESKDISSGGANLNGTITSEIAAFDQDEACPVCKNTRYLTPNMTLLVSECYHKMCESCRDRLFATGGGKCPICGKTVKKIGFKIPTFDNLLVEKEIKQRKWIASHIYKRLEDFNSLREYNDYEEKIEEFVWNMTHGIEYDKTRDEVMKYAHQNQDALARNKELMREEERKLNLRRQEEEKEKQLSWENYQRQVAEERLLKVTQKTDAIEALASSKGDAKALLAEQKAVNDRRKLLNQEAYLQAPTLSTNDSGIGDCGMDCDDNFPLDDPVDSPYEDMKKLYSRREKYWDPFTQLLPKYKPGGSSLATIHDKALQAAFSGLFVPPILDENGDILPSFEDNLRFQYLEMDLT